MKLKTHAASIIALVIVFLFNVNLYFPTFTSEGVAEDVPAQLTYHIASLVLSALIIWRMRRVRK